MIINFRVPRWNATTHMVVDAETGESLEHLRYFYADDETQTLLVHLRNDQGQPFLRHSEVDGKQEMAWEKLRFDRTFRVVRRPC